MVDIPDSGLTADGDDELDDEPTTVDDCIRLWRQALSGEGSDSVFGIAQWAADRSVDEPAVRALWMESIQRLRSGGEIDLDLSYCLIHDIVEWHFDQTDVFADPRLASIDERMQALERAYGYEEPGFFDNNPHAPRDWIVLRDEWNAREEERRRELLLAAGEQEMVRLRTQDPVEYWLRIEAVERRLKRDHIAFLRRTWNERIDGPFDDTWFR